ncbi:VanZ family protein, partial [Leucobacter soli]
MSKHSDRTVRIARILLGVFAVALGVVVLLPSDGHTALTLTARAARWAAEATGLPYPQVFAAIEFGANAALFLPLGLLLPLTVGGVRGDRSALPRTPRRTAVLAGFAVLTGFAVSLGIESLQRVIPGRVSDPRDVIANTLGALLGALILSFLLALRSEPDPATPQAAPPTRTPTPTRTPAPTRTP